MRHEYRDIHGQICRCGSPESVRVLLIFDAQELLDDIREAAFVQGDAARVNDNYGHDLLEQDREHKMHQWMDVVEDDNIHRVRRILLLAMSECEQMLHKMSYFRLGQSISEDNKEPAKPEYVIELKAHSQFSENSAVYLMRLINEYMTASVLADHAARTYPEAMAYWTAKKEDTAANIRSVATMCGVHHNVKPSII